jgi:hypothetical protein
MPDETVSQTPALDAAKAALAAEGLPTPATTELLSAVDPKPAKGYSRIDAYNAAVRPTGGYLALGVLLVVPVVALFCGLLGDAFKLFWASVSPIAGALIMYFFKTREAEKAQAGNGGAS